MDKRSGVGVTSSPARDLGSFLRSGTRMCTAICTVLGWLMLTSTNGASAEGPGLVPFEVGTVETIAGPGFCTGHAVVDGASTEVRALAVGGDGSVYFDTGPPEEALVAKVNPDGRARLIRTGAALVSGDGDASPKGESPSASRLAPDGTGGLLIAVGARILRLDAEGAGLTTVAGDPGNSRGGRERANGGDGGPALDATFTLIRSITSDAIGNVYVAEHIPRDPLGLKIRFFNRSAQPITFYAGSGHELTVASGAIDTIVGGPGNAGSGDGGPAALATLQGSPPSLALSGDGKRLYIGLRRSITDLGSSVRMINLGEKTITAHGIMVGAGAIQTVAGRRPSASGGDGSSALSASFGFLPGIAADGEGNLFVADETVHKIRKVDPAGIVTTVAGTGGTAPNDGGFNGNGRIGTDALLNRPYDVAVGPGGRIYISDQGNHQVRYIDRAGIIHTAPGNGLGLSWRCQPGQFGDEAETIRDDSPVSVVTGADGSVFFGTTSLAQVKEFKTSAPGVHTDVVGRLASAGDDSTEDRLAYPAALAASQPGALYMLDRHGGQRRIRVVNLMAERAEVHGTDIAAGGMETLAEVPSAVSPFAAGSGVIATDNQGNLYIADLQTVRRIDAQGKITTVVERSPPVQSVPTRSEEQRTLREPGEEESYSSVQTSCCAEPNGLAVDGAGNLYVSDSLGARVWFINLGPRAITVHGRWVLPGDEETIAGTGIRGFGGDGGLATRAELQVPGALAVDGNGNLYIVDEGEHTIRKVDATGKMSTVVGTGTAGFNGDGLAGPLTALDQPSDIAVDDCGNLLIADQGNSRLRRLNTVASCRQSSHVIASARGLGVFSLILIVTLVILATMAAIVAVKRRYVWDSKETSSAQRNKVRGPRNRRLVRRSVK